MRVIVTGAAGGIGAATAALLARGGHRLLIVDRDGEGLERARASMDGDVHALAADLSAIDSGDAVVAAAHDRLGGVDGLVSNAGIILGAPLADLSAVDFDRMFAINARSTWLLAKAAYPLMKAGGGGAIVATGSISASHPTPPLGAYAASKAALVMLVRQMANEWGPDGIRCNSVSPGPTLTPMTATGYADDARRTAREAGLPLRRLGAAEDVANTIAFLLSEGARNITGIDLLVDGGLSTTLMTSSGAGSGQAR